VSHCTASSGSWKRLIIGTGGQVSAEHHRVAAQAAHHDLDLMRLAALAVPAFDEPGRLVGIVEQPHGLKAIAVQLELARVGGPVPTRWAGR
jgi:hypothetical protein